LRIDRESQFVGVNTFVIALESAPRNLNLLHQLSEQKIPFQLVNAIDGRSWRAPFNTELVDTEVFKSVLGRIPRGAEIGCALSHMECIQQAKLQDLDFALIFEDDADIIGDLMPIIEQIKSIDEGQPMIFQLHSYSDSLIKRRTLRKSVSSNSQVLGNFFKPPRSAAAYCINRTAIEIYAQHRIVQGVADWPPFANCFQFWGFFPCPVMLSGLPSTIESLEDAKEVHPRKNYLVIIRDFIRLFYVSSFKAYGKSLGGKKRYIKYVIIPNVIYLFTVYKTKHHGVTPHTYRTR
jgi:GR25 family glycosyltransferase involved in LPS biosynthesis